MRPFASSLLLLATLPAMAQIYPYADANGDTLFTTPPPGDRKAQRIGRAPGIRDRPPAAPTEAKPLAYPSLRILHPEPDATLRENNGDVIVRVAGAPALPPTHRYRLLLDGKPAGEPGHGPLFALRNLDRGTHRIAVEIIDGDGMIVGSTPSHPFHLHRASIAPRHPPSPPGVP